MFFHKCRQIGKIAKGVKLLPRLVNRDRAADDALSACAWGYAASRRPKVRHSLSDLGGECIHLGTARQERRYDR
jgi:hypothetical protein